MRLVEDVTGRLLGTVDAGSSHGTVHEGAVYLHQGETYLVLELDLEDRVAAVVLDEPDYSTSAREITDIEITEEREHADWGAARVSLGGVRVTHQVVSFLRRRVPSGESLGEEPLDLPERTLDTTAVWWTLPPALLAAGGVAAVDLPGAAHAAEHASIGLLPLFATCDRWDIGGVSTALHPDTGHAHRLRVRRAPGRRRLRRARVPRRPGLADRDAGGDRGLPLRGGLPVLRAVAEVREPEQPARQARRGRPARRPARRRLTPPGLPVTPAGTTPWTDPEGTPPCSCSASS